jgi:hypothetical protein
MGNIRPSGSFDSAPSSTVSRDRSVTRSAQDDDFVGVLTKNLQNKLALMGLHPGYNLVNSQPSLRAVNRKNLEGLKPRFLLGFCGPTKVVP